MWSLYEEKGGEAKPLSPLVFSNNKTQEDVVKEVIESIKQGQKVIFIKGVCGTGKSAIALNIAKELGKASIVVPIKNLQNQYETDYSGKKFLLKKNGDKLKIKVITGRQNHICPFLKKEPIEIKEINSRLDIFDEGISVKTDLREKNKTCDNPNLPCKIEIKEKNLGKIREYLRKNPKIKSYDFSNASFIKRMSIAPVCPYWSPIAPSKISLDLDAKCRVYEGLGGIKYTLYQRTPGCPYYEQFNSYLDSDVLIFNSQKYKIETMMNRKPATEVEIIDECDEFLDSFSNTKKINLNRLSFALANLFPEDDKTRKLIDELSVLTRQITKEKQGKNKFLLEEIIPIKETQIYKILREFLDSDFMNFVECDEENYCFYCDEVARTFQGFFEETFVSFDKEDKDLIVRIVTTNLEKRFKEMIEKNKVFVMMSGTIHSENVLQKIFGLTNYKIIDAETQMQGKIEKHKTGEEQNCKYSNFEQGVLTREQYLKALEKCIEQAKRPVLVHVNSFSDLPTEKEAESFGLMIMTQEKLKHLQSEESIGDAVRRFKEGKTDILYSTKCNRGVDFPGTTCNSIILTKYPYPNVKSIFWKILRKNRPELYNEFYLDKSKREFLQRIYRGLRSKEDTIFLLSPDSRVFYSI